MEFDKVKQATSRLARLASESEYTDAGSESEYPNQTARVKFGNDVKSPFGLRQQRTAGFHRNTFNKTIDEERTTDVLNFTLESTPSVDYLNWNYIPTPPRGYDATRIPLIESTRKEGEIRIKDNYAKKFVKLMASTKEKRKKMAFDVAKAGFRFRVGGQKYVRHLFAVLFIAKIKHTLEDFNLRCRLCPGGTGSDEEE